MSVQPEPTPASHFAQVASRFCATLETAPASAVANLNEIRTLAAELHLAALKLPDLPADAGAPEPPEPDRTRIARQRLTAWAVSFYWDVFEPLNPEPGQPVGNSIDDDLSDIYGDLRRGLFLYEQGFHSSACWHWRFTFEVHWGEHLTGMQRALYWLASEHLLPDPLA